MDGCVEMLANDPNSSQLRESFLQRLHDDKEALRLEIQSLRQEVENLRLENEKPSPDHSKGRQKKTRVTLGSLWFTCFNCLYVIPRKDNLDMHSSERMRIYESIRYHFMNIIIALFHI